MSRSPLSHYSAADAALAQSKCPRRAPSTCGAHLGGGVAAAESHSVQARLRRTPVSEVQAGPALREMAHYFSATDARLACTLEYGLAGRL
jgi:hypothetical protein